MHAPGWRCSGRRAQLVPPTVCSLEPCGDSNFPRGSPCMPPSVGLEMPKAGSGLRMMLSIHYSKMGEPIDDASGVEVCVARNPREHTAGPHNVGTHKIELPPHQATNIKARCTPKYSRDIHIINTQPHHSIPALQTTAAWVALIRGGEQSQGETLRNASTGRARAVGTRRFLVTGVLIFGHAGAPSPCR